MSIFRKRAAAKRLIERYYYQLTDGCGDNDCRNENCASCNAFVYKNLSRNELAVHALHLVKQKARLCGAHPPKIAKRPPESKENATTSISCMKSGELNVRSGISVRLDGGSSSSSAGGISTHYPVAMDFGAKEEQPSTSNMKPSAHHESTLSGKNCQVYGLTFTSDVDISSTLELVSSCFICINVTCLLYSQAQICLLGRIDSYTLCQET